MVSGGATQTSAIVDVSPMMHKLLTEHLAYLRSSIRTDEQFSVVD